MLRSRQAQARQNSPCQICGRIPKQSQPARHQIRSSERGCSSSCIPALLRIGIPERKSRHRTAERHPRTPVNRHDKDIFEFYDTNLNRNEIFVKNLTKDKSNKIVIAGGFHSEIVKELKKLNISYIVLTPNLNINNAFNELFSTTLKYGTDEQKISDIISILDSWKIFFTNTQSFQEAVNSWIQSSDELRDKLYISINDESNITISYNDLTITKNFDNISENKIPSL